MLISYQDISPTHSLYISVVIIRTGNGRSLQVAVRGKPEECLARVWPSFVRSWVAHQHVQPGTQKYIEVSLSTQKYLKVHRSTCKYLKGHSTYLKVSQSTQKLAIVCQEMGGALHVEPGTQKYFKVQRSFSQYLEAPRSTCKYLKVHFRTYKYLKVACHRLLGLGDKRTWMATTLSLATQHIMCQLWSPHDEGSNCPLMIPPREFNSNSMMRMQPREI